MSSIRWGHVRFNRDDFVDGNQQQSLWQGEKIESVEVGNDVCET